MIFMIGAEGIFKIPFASDNILMKAIVLLIPLLFNVAYGQSWADSLIKQINEQVAVIELSNLITQADTIESKNDNGEGFSLYTSTSKNDKKLKRCTVEMISKANNEECKKNTKSCMVFYFYNDYLIKVDESLEQTKSGVWFFSNKKLVQCTLRKIMSADRIETREQQLLEMADNFLAKSR